MILEMSKEEFEQQCQELTRTERNILFLYLRGMSPMAIVEATEYSENTVSKRLAAACRKFGFEKPEGEYYRDVRRQVVELFVQYSPAQVNREYFGYEVPKAGKIISGSIPYVARPILENACYATITQSGSILRIKGPANLGKTTILNQLLSRAAANGYDTIHLSFEFADQSVFGNLEDFSKWLCAVVSHELDCPNQIEEAWQNVYACNFNTTSYFERYLLAQRENPLVLALDDTDLVFEQPAIAIDFCKLLRGWNSRAGSSRLWQSLRIVIVHNTEIYGALDINTSPLANVGKVVELPELTSSEVKSLAEQNGLELKDNQTSALMTLIGGHPLLIQIVFDHMKQGKNLFDLLQNAHTDAGIFRTYLRTKLEMLQRNPSVASAFNQVIESKEPLQIDSNIKFQLFGMGVIALEGNLAKPRNKLYRQYFQNRL